MPELKKRYTIVIVTHNMQQAARVSDDTGYILLGELVEFGDTRQHLHRPPRPADRGLHHRPVRLRFGYNGPLFTTGGTNDEKSLQVAAPGDRGSRAADILHPLG